jgi:single-strand DNA-binding protein
MNTTGGFMKPETTIVGRLGSKMDLLKVGDSSVIRFSVAVDTSYMDKDNKRVERTDWFQLEAWDGKAKIIDNHAMIGQTIIARAFLEDASYLDGNNKKVYKTKFTASYLKLIPGPLASQKSNSITHNDIPFN